MKKIFATAPLALGFALWFSGCNGIGSKTASMSIIYGAAAVLALLLLIGCCFVRKKTVWFIVLFSSVLVVNIGYFSLSVSPCLEAALLANRIAYLGSVFLPMSMLMIILKVTNTSYSKWLPKILLGIALIVLFVAASPGYLDIYYKEVSFEIVNGTSTLVKVYGPWHCIYLFYLLGYFGTMVGVIIRSIVKKSFDPTAHAVILAVAVFVNIGVWFVEQLVRIDFEILSISYIISEMFLLGLHFIMNENQRLKELVKEKESAPNFVPVDTAQQEAIMAQPDGSVKADRERIEAFLAGLDELTPTERLIYESYIARVTTKEIMASLNIKENTLKFHNKNIYSKLGVSSRKELLEIYKKLKAISDAPHEVTTE